jgi:hypothetical protein
MKVLIGAMLSWIIIGAVLGVSIFLMTARKEPIVWPFVLSSILLLWTIKRVGCSTH